MTPTKPKHLNSDSLSPATDLLAVVLQLLELSCMQRMRSNPHDHLNDDTDRVVIIVKALGRALVEGLEPLLKGQDTVERCLQSLDIGLDAVHSGFGSFVCDQRASVGGLELPERAE